MNKVVNLEEELNRFISTPNVFSFIRFPFLLDPSSKTKLLQIEAEQSMGREMRSVFLVGALSGFAQNNSSFFNILLIRRNNLIQDSLDQIASKNSSELKKPLKVVFINEPAIDEGGVTKEFFHLCVQQILDPDYGMFIEIEDKSGYWFNQNSLEHSSQFFLIGSLLGLAIYNGVIIPAQFPLILYKKLLRQLPKSRIKNNNVDHPMIHNNNNNIDNDNNNNDNGDNDDDDDDLNLLESLNSIYPSLTRGLKQLIDFNGDNHQIEETFGLNFVVEYERFGERKSHELKEVKIF